MKRFILLIPLFFLIFMSNVKADEVYSYEIKPSIYDFVTFENHRYDQKNFYRLNDWEEFISDSNNREIFDNLYKNVVDTYNSKYKDEYPYYGISVSLFTKTKNPTDLHEVVVSLRCAKYGFEVISTLNYFYYRSINSTPSEYVAAIYFDDTYFYNYQDDTFNNLYKDDDDIYYKTSYPGTNLPYEPSPSTYAPAYYFESNVDLYFNINLKIYDDNNEVIKDYKVGDLIPPLYKDGYDLNSTPSTYTTVDLDKYDYVILNLKDYNQDKSFNTNLKVKGSLGITPIYNFGQIAKDDIMGSKIEDRCNVKYDDYTDYRLSILKQDLQNNAIYAVKECENGSSFKFDNSVFDITYVTDENKDDPIVSIGGKDYHVIPFDKLPSTANQNEKDNYVPGESANLQEKLTFSKILENVTDTLNSVWTSIVTFMTLITRLFNTLPVEFRAVSITSFTIMCVLGIIKFMKS